MKNLKHKKKNQKSSRGFTLIELMVSLSVFVILMSLITGSILSVLDLNSKAQSKKTAIDNLDFALETMSRVIRFGVNYHCGSAGTLSAPADCSTGASSLTVLAADGTQVTYSLSGGALMRSINGGTSLALTAPEVSIQTLTFRVFGSLPYGSDFLQPQVIVTLSGTAGNSNKPRTQSTFRMETTVSQRKLDI